MYEFVSGPLVWISFIVFIGGSLYRLVSMHKLAKKEKVIYPYMSLKYGLRSIIHWIIPFASTNMRRRPLMTIITFAFHICLVLTPIFLLSHNLLWRQSWKISWRTLSEGTADIMTVIVILAAIFFLVRRLVLSEVRYVTFPSDYALLAIALAPFLTGFLAYHQWLPYKTILILHILSGEIMLIAIPFTRLSHMLYFVFTRAYMGSEFGAVRNSKDW
ncbi:MAG: nitrate reductase [Deltaproteobacteria bacterium CG12_big_fil_rev_8_21_14_0_65_43_10]|nr:MAG: nitrate reductase [Deltaproteobacteria bacterium CG2_30_43_15]PIQ46568.1 MAG: nitrate reductase [Deltaproteobacteria bacterium CG12_big_fil_rev_8_21_14_0_65_43_10]PIU85077.1 MAG: nitrate reductase [Deltaproteobacteria bacterium CG06_land_8_20_14_3_00_44_19]PIX26739.1 MAG: nitrate reductase [Deltaproteobacteria bacterium CG_4_8_14_3_um_filter_43_13]HCX89547.1 nitrate reductase [Deltaproteobacteria bacterium]